MKRREFLKSTLAASCLPLAATTTGNGDETRESRQVLEWRRYVLRNDDQHRLVSNFLRTAVLPALKRLEIGPFGVFTETGDGATPAIYTLTPADSLAQMAAIGTQLADDQEFLAAAKDYLSTDKESPAYERIDNQWMVAFSGFPKVKVPRHGDRIFELRVYESHNEHKAKLKIEMFNEAEFPIFEKVGLDGVFFGETVVGTRLPNLTYMLGYKDMAEHDRAWEAFFEHPDWIELRERDRYRDTVSKIENRFLQPTEFSQI